MLETFLKITIKRILKINTYSNTKCVTNFVNIQRIKLQVLLIDNQSTMNDKKYKV